MSARRFLLSLTAVMLLAVLSAAWIGPARAVAPEDRAVVCRCSEYITLRETASKQARALIRVPLGAEVEILAFADNGFVKVRYFDKVGYVLEDYLDPWEESAYVPRTQSASGHNVYCGNWGTAKRIEGRTVVVSIFANDATTRWNFDNDHDSWLRLRTRFNLSLACAWLTEQTRVYRANPGGFVWDWREHGDLYFEHTFSEDIVHGRGDQDVVGAITGFIHNSVPTQRLLSDHRADNIIYNVYLNAPNDTGYRSWARATLYGPVEPDKYMPEFCVIVPYSHGLENTGAVFAHEMLHCFGAYDLYETYAGSPITQKYVDYLMSHSPNDLMNHCSYSDGDVITNRFSAVDAYYVGLIRTCDDVTAWGLGESIFDKYPEN